MSIALIIQAALKAKREKDTEERISSKKEYQAIFSRTIKSREYVRYPEIKKMSTEPESLAKFFFESSLKPKIQDRKARLHFYPRHQKGKEASEQLFKYHLEAFCDDIFQDEAMLFSKLNAARIWQNTASYLDHTEKKFLRGILLTRNSSAMRNDALIINLKGLAGLSDELSLYRALAEKCLYSIFIGAFCMALSLLFMFTPLPVLLSIFSVGFFVFSTSLALGGYGQYHGRLTLGTMKGSINALPMAIHFSEEIDDKSPSSIEQPLL